MTLYHWTLNAEKILQLGFYDRNSRHTDDKEGIWFTDQLLGTLDGIHQDMKLLTVDIPLANIEEYEEKNGGIDYRMFRIPANIVNEHKINTPVVYIDRGIYKINK